MRNTNNVYSCNNIWYSLRMNEICIMKIYVKYRKGKKRKIIGKFANVCSKNNNKCSFYVQYENF